MKRLLNIFLAVVLVVACAFGLTACVPPDETGDKKEGVLIKKENGVYVIYDYVDDGTLVNGELNLGEILSAKGITEAKIKSGAFDGADNIRTLIVPDTVVEIQAGAFRKMSNLYELRVPFIGKNAKADAQFEQTDEIEGKAINKQRTFAHFFGTEEYDGGASLKNEFGTVYLPYTLTTVVVNATSNVDYSISYTDGNDDVIYVKQGYAIPMGAFEGAKTLLNIRLEGVNLKEIGEKAFSGCTGLNTITIPNTVDKIYDNAFVDCTNLTEVKVEAKAVSDEKLKLGKNVFAGCFKMNKINSQNNLTIDLSAFSEIGSKAFDFGRENVEYTVVNKGLYDLSLLFGTTQYTK